MTNPIEALYAAAQKATPGPWRVEYVSDAGFIIIGKANNRGGWDHVASVPTYENTAETGAFIAAADPATVTALIEVYRAARKVWDEQIEPLPTDTMAQIGVRLVFSSISRALVALDALDEEEAEQP